ncbi:hypothetical protein B0J14DRAFT_570361 [Halenospora varia]|nr:hypothetical protein B0J14DRAFT_570361 [Halenospora varia]
MQSTSRVKQTERAIMNIPMNVRTNIPESHQMCGECKRFSEFPTNPPKSHDCQHCLGTGVPRPIPVNVITVEPVPNRTRPGIPHLVPENRREAQVHGESDRHRTELRTRLGRDTDRNSEWRKEHNRRSWSNSGQYGHRHGPQPRTPWIARSGSPATHLYHERPRSTGVYHDGRNLPIPGPHIPRPQQPPPISGAHYVDAPQGRSFPRQSTINQSFLDTRQYNQRPESPPSTPSRSWSRSNSRRRARSRSTHSLDSQSSLFDSQDSRMSQSSTTGSIDGVRYRCHPRKRSMSRNSYYGKSFSDPRRNRQYGSRRRDRLVGGDQSPGRHVNFQSTTRFGEHRYDSGDDSPEENADRNGHARQNRHNLHDEPERGRPRVREENRRRFEGGRDYNGQRITPPPPPRDELRSQNHNFVQLQIPPPLQNNQFSRPQQGAPESRREEYNRSQPFSGPNTHAPQQGPPPRNDLPRDGQGNLGPRQQNVPRAYQGHLQTYPQDLGKPGCQNLPGQGQPGNPQIYQGNQQNGGPPGDRPGPSYNSANNRPPNGPGKGDNQALAQYRPGVQPGLYQQGVPPPPPPPPPGHCPPNSQQGLVSYGPQGFSQPGQRPRNGSPRGQGPHLRASSPQWKRSQSAEGTLLVKKIAGKTLIATDKARRSPRGRSPQGGIYCVGDKAKLQAAQASGSPSRGRSRVRSRHSGEKKNKSSSKSKDKKKPPMGLWRKKNKWPVIQVKFPGMG